MAYPIDDADEPKRLADKFPLRFSVRRATPLGSFHRLEIGDDGEDYVSAPCEQTVLSSSSRSAFANNCARRGGSQVASDVAKIEQENGARFHFVGP